MLKDGDVEVDEQSDLPAAEPQIGQKLCVMDGVQSFYRFEFDYNPIRYQQVNPVAAVQLDALIRDRESSLLHKGHPSQAEFPAHAGQIRRL